MIQGLDLVDLYTEQGEGRLIDNIVLQSDLVSMPVVGFENHGGRTYINGNKPFGKVLYGSGNDGESGYEGVVYQECDWYLSARTTASEESRSLRLAARKSSGTEIWKC